MIMIAAALWLNLRRGWMAGPIKRLMLQQITALRTPYTRLKFVRINVAYRIVIQRLVHVSDRVGPAFLLIQNPILHRFSFEDGPHFHPDCLVEGYEKNQYNYPTCGSLAHGNRRCGSNAGGVPGTNRRKSSGHLAGK